MDKTQIVKGTIIQKFVSMVSDDQSRSSGFSGQVLREISYLLDRYAPVGSVQEIILSEAIMQLAPNTRSAVHALVQKARTMKTDRPPELVLSPSASSISYQSTQPAAHTSAKKPESEYEIDIDNLALVLNNLPKFGKTLNLVSSGLLMKVRDDLEASFYGGLGILLGNSLLEFSQDGDDSPVELSEETKKSVNDLVSAYINLGVMTSELLIAGFIKEWEKSQTLKQIMLAVACFTLEAHPSISKYEFSFGPTIDDVDFDGLKGNCGITKRDIDSFRHAAENASDREDMHVLFRKFERLFREKNMIGYAQETLQRYIAWSIMQFRNSERITVYDNDSLRRVFECIVQTAVLTSSQRFLWGEQYVPS